MGSEMCIRDSNLTQYEVVPVEPLHDLKEHINNILKELPTHLTDEEKTLFEEAIEAVPSTKEKLRGADYRLCCIVIALHLGSNCRLSIRRLLYNLAELCELLYTPSDKRSPGLFYVYIMSHSPMWLPCVKYLRSQKSWHAENSMVYIVIASPAMPHSHHV